VSGVSPRFSSINPATGRRIRNYPEHSRARIEAALKRAQAAFKRWRNVPPAGRARTLRAAGSILRKRADEFAALITLEMGKPVAEARSEVMKCAAVCDYYAKYGRVFLAEERAPGASKDVRLAFEPIGIVLAIMPWNFPFWQVFRAAAPALMAGNTVLLKPSPNVSGCALAIEAVFRASAKEHLLQTLLIPTRKIPAIIADPRVQGVTLTGSTAAGRRVASLAGAAMKKGVFELGGSDPYLILEDADLDHAAEICAQSRLLNAGQSCISAKRFIVVASVRREFEGKFAARLAARRVGDPRDPATEVGPMARRDLRDHLHAQVRASIAAGAQLQFGGRPLAGPGFYYAPTLLTNVTKGQPAYAEELFGPVAAVIPVRDEVAAIAAANDSIYGLGAAVFSRNLRRARRVAARIEAGTVFINDFVRSDPAVPFGGIKQSGHGRELGLFGLREFANVKAIRLSSPRR
jgi:succinate-semialdehyde dehydrogenase / glutarate-semialdehyde dehydrogenase